MTMLPDDSGDWIKLDTSKPRSTVDFINDAWMCRNSPVYGLRSADAAVLRSSTLKGWFWRLVLRIVRYSRPKSVNLDGTEATVVPLCLAGDPTAKPESDRTMEHYLTVAQKFTPELQAQSPAATSYSCDCTEFHQVVKPRKPRKKARKPAAKKARKR